MAIKPSDDLREQWAAGAGIRIGTSAGHHFFKSGIPDLQVAYHAVKVTPAGKCVRGYFFSRKRLVDRKAFDYDPAMGWETDRWFEWPDDEKEGEHVH